MDLRRKLFSFKSVTNARLFGRAIPLTVTISISGKCNHRCAYCSIWRQEKEQMTQAEVFWLIKALAKMGTQRIGFTQDEPLLRSDIGRIIDFCKEQGIFVTLGSNGSLVEARIQELKNLDILLLSFDGPPAVHDAQRIPGAFDQVMRAIAIAPEHGIKVWTTTVLTKHNLDCIDYILEKAETLGFRAAFQLVYHSPRVAGKANDMIPSPVEYRRAIRKIIAHKRHGLPVINSFALLHYLHDWPDYTNPFFDPHVPSKHRLKCWGGSLFCHIESNGDLYPCSQLTGKPLNSVKTGIKEALDNARRNRCAHCCLGADYVEYNLLFSLHPEALWNARAL